LPENEFRDVRNGRAILEATRIEFTAIAKHEKGATLAHDRQRFLPASNGTDSLASAEVNLLPGCCLVLLPGKPAGY
jgi:hypothetical protein